MNSFDWFDVIFLALWGPWEWYFGKTSYDKATSQSGQR